jgi:hypothetical protein
MSKPGPKTAAARRAVRRNALKHGIRSDLVVIDQQEDPKEWESFRDGIVSSLEPEGSLEEVLAEEIAFLHWKIRRVASYQAYQTRYYIDKTERNLKVAAAYANRTLAQGELPDIEPEVVGRWELLRSLPPQEELDKIMRYEAHLHRRWVQTLHELQALQARRHGDAAPLARLDVSASPA